MRWRIDPSLIEFIGGTSEVEGGHATVSRALLTVASATGGDLNEPKNVEGGPKSRDGNVQRKVRCEYHTLPFQQGSLSSQPIPT